MNDITLHCRPARNCRLEVIDDALPALFIFLLFSTYWATVASGATEETFTVGSLSEEKDASKLSRFFTENIRLNFEVVELSQRVEGAGTSGWSHDLGIDLQKIFSSDYGDIGTLTFQGSYGKRDNASSLHGHGSAENVWSWMTHSVYVRYNGFGQGDTGLKFGLFDLPFGLEQNFDTHFQLRQLMSASNLGMKKDWGVSIDRHGKNIDYELALTRGSGSSYRYITRPAHSMERSAGGNWAVSARLSTPSSQNFSHGLSVYHGETPHLSVHSMSVADPMNMGGHEEMAQSGMGENHMESMTSPVLQRRTRFGYDAVLLAGPVSVYTELSLGRNFDANVQNALAGLEWQSNDATLIVYSQVIYLNEEDEYGRWDDSISSQIGTLYTVNRFLSLALQYDRVYDSSKMQANESKFQLQLRLYY